MRRHLDFPKRILNTDDGVGVVDEEAKEQEQQKPPSPMEDKPFLGSTENMKHHEYETTEEIKAMTQEVIRPSGTSSAFLRVRTLGCPNIGGKQMMSVAPSSLSLYH